jgi:hypothetical protein
MNGPKIAIFGGGPAALCAADHLSERFEVTIYEKGKTIGRKFLVAGKGGFNLTNELDGEALIGQYSPRKELSAAIQQFGSAKTRAWLNNLGLETFVGSSGRVFPIEGWKPAQVLNLIKSSLIKKGVQINTGCEFNGWSDDGVPLVKTQEGLMDILADAYVFALGGGSWKKTGSNDKWMPILDKMGVKTTPFEPSNCGLTVRWNASFIDKYAGTPLKNLGVSFYKNYWRGEAVITEYGLEGNVIYPLSAVWRDRHHLAGKTIFLDFKPDNSLEQLKAKANGVETNRYRSRLNITKSVLEMVKWSMNKADYANPSLFVEKLKRFPIEVEGLRPVEEGISTVGGVTFESLTPNFEWKRKPNYFSIGEMIAWDAPTGGFLLQGCFAMGYAVANYLNETHET